MSASHVSRRNFLKGAGIAAVAAAASAGLASCGQPTTAAHTVLAAGAGVHSSLSTAIAMGTAFLLVWLFADRITLNSLCRSPLVLTLCGLLLIPASGIFGEVLSGYLISTSNSVMTLVVTLLMYDLSKRFGMAIICLVGASKVSALCKLVGNWVASASDASSLAEASCTAIVLGIVLACLAASTLLVLSERGVTASWGIAPKNEVNLSEEDRLDGVIAANCTAVTRDFGLSPREDEIIRLLARGKTNAAISRELFVAEGTIKAHLQHIYVKTGIHSSKELAERLLRED